MTELKRIIKAGFINFTRGGLISFAAVLIVTITLSFITSIILLQTVLYSSLNIIKDKVDVTIYFTVGASEDQIMLFKSSLEKLPEVANVSYVSAEENLKSFRERHANDYSTIGASEDQIMLFKSSLEKLPEVANVSYVSAEENLKSFRERHANDYST